MTAVCKPDEKYYDPAPTMCEMPSCKSKADYGNMDIEDDAGYETGITVCKVHATAIGLYNDWWREDTEWENLTKQEKHRVSQIVYRWHKQNRK